MASWTWTRRSASCTGCTPTSSCPPGRGSRPRAKADKETGLAKAIESIRKPTAAAWAINQLVRARPDDMERLVELGVRAARGTGEDGRRRHEDAGSGTDQAHRRAGPRDGGGGQGGRRLPVHAGGEPGTRDVRRGAGDDGGRGGGGFGAADPGAVLRGVRRRRPVRGDGGARARPGGRRYGSSRARARGPGAARDGRPNPSPSRRSRPSRTRRCSSGWPRPRSVPARRCRRRPRPATR